MIITCIALTDDINKVPRWRYKRSDRDHYGRRGFIESSSFFKRILVRDHCNDGIDLCTMTDIVEPIKGIFVYTLELPYDGDMRVSGDYLNPCIYVNWNDTDRDVHENVVIIQVDRDVCTYLDSGTGPISRKHDNGSVILNTFHAKNWLCCIARIGDGFIRRSYNPLTERIGMYVDYAVNGEPKSKMLYEMQITGLPTGVNITNGLVKGDDCAKKLLRIYDEKTLKTFRIKTVQRLSNLIFVPVDEWDEARAAFEIGADHYLFYPYDTRYVQVSVDDNRNVVESERVQFQIKCLFAKNSDGDRPLYRSAIFYNCRPSSAFFKAGIDYIFIAYPPTDEVPLSYYSLICP